MVAILENRVYFLLVYLVGLLALLKVRLRVVRLLAVVDGQAEHLLGSVILRYVQNLVKAHKV